MNIRIGDSLGHYFDRYLYDLARQLSYKIKHNILLERNSEMFQGIYEIYPGFLPSKGELLVDIGAQYADYSILANRKYGADVIAFEPLLENWIAATRSIERNKAVVELHNCGLSDEEYSLMMGYNGNMLDIGGQGDKEASVSLTTLDSFDFNPDLLKIDVEGFEMHVLRGAINTIIQHKPRIIIETHSLQLEREVRDFLGKLGYGIPKEGRRTRGIGWMDSVVNLFFMYGGN